MVEELAGCHTQRIVVNGSVSKQWPVLSSGFSAGTGTVQHLFCPMDGGIKSKSATETELWGTVNTLEAGDVTQRDLDTLGQWVCAKLIEFNEVQGPTLCWGNPKHKISVSGE